MEEIRVEILAPAGSYESVISAINAGTDAVYIGGSRFGARAYADNPEEDMLIKAIDYVHLYGKKIYLTVNTLLKNNEIKKELYNYLLPYYEAGLDAVIVQDLGVFKCIHKWFPDLDIHASTQMVISGPYGASLLKNMGASRIVTARELPLDEIREISSSCDIEIESFVHGALCYCYSGQCLMSSMLGGRSGNRGRCAQPCRLPYDIALDGKIINKSDEKYILSPKDMCTIKILPEIIKAGVYSLKIEGRMKSPEYTAGVVSIYRKYVDLLSERGFDNYSVTDTDYKILEQIYSRSGFNESYYKQHNGRNMMTLSKPSYSGQNEQIIEQIHEEYIVKKRKLPIEGKVDIVAGQPLSVTVSRNNYIVTVSGDAPDEALNRPISKDMVLKQMNKTGSTDFEFDNIDVNIEGNVFVQVRILNELRREALDKLSNCILEEYRRKSEYYCESEDSNMTDSDITLPSLNCMIRNIEQFNEVIKNKNVDWIYIPVDSMDFTENLCNRVHDCGKKIALVMPYVFRKTSRQFFDENLSRFLMCGLDAVMVRNIDEFEYVRVNFNNIPVITDYYMYAFNDYAYDFYMENGVVKITEPLELNLRELRQKNRHIGEIVAYGYIPLMVTAGCVNKNIRSCDNKSHSLNLIDRYNAEFRVENICRFCYNLIYNSVPLSYLSVSDDILKLSPEALRLQFTVENEDEVRKILDSFTANYFGDGKVAEIANSTRGHLKRGVE